MVYPLVCVRMCVCLRVYVRSAYDLFAPWDTVSRDILFFLLGASTACRDFEVKSMGSNMAELKRDARVGRRRVSG